MVRPSKLELSSCQVSGWRGVNDHEIVPMASRFSGPHYILRFIEFMDVGNRNAWRADEVVTSADLLRQIRGRKFVSGPQGEVYNLEEIFEQLNAAHFDGLMARPALAIASARASSAFGRT